MHEAAESAVGRKSAKTIGALNLVSRQGIARGQPKVPRERPSTRSETKSHEEVRPRAGCGRLDLLRSAGSIAKAAPRPRSILARQGRARRLQRGGGGRQRGWETRRREIQLR